MTDDGLAAPVPMTNDELMRLGGLSHLSQHAEGGSHFVI